MILRTFLISCLFVLGVGVMCSQSSATAGHEIRSALSLQAKAWNRGDIDGYMAYYWKSDSLLFTSGGNVQRGWNATLEKYQRSYDSRAKMGRLEFSDLESTLLSPTAAWVFGRWTLIRETDTPGGVFTLVLRKFPDGWKIIHDHTSVATR